MGERSTVVAGLIVASFGVLLFGSLLFTPHGDQNHADPATKKMREVIKEIRASREQLEQTNERVREMLRELKQRGE